MTWDNGCPTLLFCTTVLSGVMVPNLLMCWMHVGSFCLMWDLLLNFLKQIALYRSTAIVSGRS